MANQKLIDLLPNWVPAAAVALIASFAGQSALAAPVYTTLITNDINFSTIDAGTTFASGSASVAGGGFMSATASAMGTQIGFSADVTQGTGTAPNIQATGTMSFVDVVFTDLSDPFNNGTINVSVNFLLDWTASPLGTHSVQVLVGLLPAPPFNPTNVHNQFYGAGLFNETTGTVPVQLNTAYTFFVSGSLDRRGGGAVGEVRSALGTLVLASIPFSMDPSFTANSVDANIVNNSIVPEPSTFAFGVLGLLGFAGYGRRHQKRKHAA